MAPIDTPIDDRALDSLSVAPDADDEGHGRDAGQDETINARLKDDPTDVDAQLDTALDETMDASDPVSTTQPGTSGDPAPSSGYDEDAERAR